ncbi:MAG: DNA mismatch endonuclease Vsr [Pseudomonadota bacterium]
MADVLSSEQRQRCMSSVGNKDTKPERMLRSLLHRSGLRYRLHRSDLPGSPDLVFPSCRAVIFVHGCYWHYHGCARSSVPKTRSDFWRKKLQDNRDRDRRTVDALVSSNWRVLLVWECALIGKNKVGGENLVTNVVRWLNSDVRFAEISSQSQTG